MDVNILHYPRLDTVLMVEDFIRLHSGEYTKTKLWKGLPKKMMYQSFCVIMNYIEKSNKIVYDRRGVIVWVWDPKGVQKYLKRKDLLVEI